MQNGAKIKGRQATWPRRVEAMRTPEADGATSTPPLVVDQPKATKSMGTHSAGLTRLGGIGERYSARILGYYGPHFVISAPDRSTCSF